MKTNELSGAALDYAVAKCELLNGADYTLAVDKDIDGALRVNFGGMYPEWCTDWQEGGAIIEREGIAVWQFDDVTWRAMGKDAVPDPMEGATPLVAAMRVYVSSKLGDEVQLPEELSDENAY